MQPTKVLILGGGFGGLYTVLELEKALGKDPNVDITLVNRENFFLFTPMLHEVAASDLDITTIVNPIRKMLRRTNFFDGEVKSIDLANKRVMVSHGIQTAHPHELGFDHLIIALGSVTNYFDIPGLSDGHPRPGKFICLTRRHGQAAMTVSRRHRRRCESC